jgi:hypothetical protein
MKKALVLLRDLVSSFHIGMTTRTSADQSVIKNFVDIECCAFFTRISQTFSNNDTFENLILWYCVRAHVLNRPPLQSSVRRSETMSARAESLKNSSYSYLCCYPFGNPPVDCNGVATNWPGPSKD